MCDFLTSILETIIGGLLITVILFLINEFIFNKIKLNGCWEVESLTEHTSYNPYGEIKLFHQFHLLQKNYDIFGSGEKYKEITKDGIIEEYEPKKRIEMEITGYYERNFFKKSIINLYLLETGEERRVRTSYTLIIINRNKLQGRFITTAANSSGTVKLKRID